MNDNNRTNFANPDLWIRLIYMVLFGLLSWLARVVVLIIAAVQFLLVLLAGSGNHNLRRLGDSIARWTQQTYLFLSFASEQKPYPFQDWPAPEESGELDSGAGEQSPASGPENPDQGRPTEG